MQPTTHELTTTAHQLAYYLDINTAHKHTRRQPPQARIMAPTFGPRDPGDTTSINLEIQIHKDLKHWAHSINQDIQDPTIPTNCQAADYAKWIANTAHKIATWQDSETLNEELKRYTTIIKKHVGDQTPTKTTQPPRPAQTIIQTMQKFGITLTRRKLAEWASRGHITAHKTMTPHGYRNYYNLQEVIKYCQNNPKTQPKVYNCETSDTSNHKDTANGGK